MNDGDDWLPVSDVARANIVRSVSADWHNEISDTAEVHTRPLSFYRDAVLMRVAEPHGPDDSASYFLYQEGLPARLDGKALPIHQVNATEPIQLSEDNVLDYLSFFCRFVHGDEGAFRLLRDARELSAFQGMDGKTPAELAGVVRPPSLLRRSKDDGSFLCEGFILYGNDLFTAQFSVTPFGMVDMLSDQPVEGFKKDTNTRPTAQAHRSQQARPKF